jgi:hypothetical protein
LSEKNFTTFCATGARCLILFGMPIAQILIFGFALTNEVKDSEILVVDYAKDNASQELSRRSDQAGISTYGKLH